MKKPMTTAERKREWRKRLKRLGLAEYRVLIPDTAEAREVMRKKAEQLSKNYVRKISDDQRHPSIRVETDGQYVKTSKSK